MFIWRFRHLDISGSGMVANAPFRHYINIAVKTLFKFRTSNLNIRSETTFFPAGPIKGFSTEKRDLKPKDEQAQPREKSFLR